MLRGWYDTARQNKSQIARTADAMDRRVAENAGRFSDTSQQWRPNPADRRHDLEGG